MDVATAASWQDGVRKRAESLKKRNAETRRKVEAYDRLEAWLGRRNEAFSHESSFAWNLDRVAEIRAVLEGK